MPGSRPRSRSNITVKPSEWSSTFSSPITVDTVTKPACESPVATSAMARRCCAGRCSCRVSPPWSVGV